MAFKGWHAEALLGKNSRDMVQLEREARNRLRPRDLAVPCLWLRCTWNIYSTYYY